MADLTKWEIIAKRKRLRKSEGVLTPAERGLKFRHCELCGRQYCCNNSEDRKVRVTKWHGIELCAHCRHNVLPGVRRLMDRKIIKLGKKYRTERNR